MICRPMKMITNQLFSNSVAKAVTPVVVSLFKKKKPQVLHQDYIDMGKKATFFVIFLCSFSSVYLKVNCITFSSQK